MGIASLPDRGAQFVLGAHVAICITTAEAAADLAPDQAAAAAVAAAATKADAAAAATAELEAMRAAAATAEAHADEAAAKAAEASATAAQRGRTAADASHEAEAVGTATELQSQSTYVNPTPITAHLRPPNPNSARQYAATAVVADHSQFYTTGLQPMLLVECWPCDVYAACPGCGIAPV